MLDWWMSKPYYRKNSPLATWKLNPKTFFSTQTKIILLIYIMYIGTQAVILSNQHLTLMIFVCCLHHFMHMLIKCLHLRMRINKPIKSCARCCDLLKCFEKLYNLFKQYNRQPFHISHTLTFQGSFNNCYFRRLSIGRFYETIIYYRDRSLRNCNWKFLPVLF